MRNRGRIGRTASAASRASDKILAAARSSAADRQRALDEVCRAALAGFIGREITPVLAAEAEGCIRAAINDAVRSGKYVVPEGLTVDRVEIGLDLRIKVLFSRDVMTP